MNRDSLEEPFEPEQIEQRIGTYGNVLEYVEGHTVIKRLNDAFDGKWFFEILRCGNDNRKLTTCDNSILTTLSVC